jgi:hypothetical protein
VFIGMEKYPLLQSLIKSLIKPLTPEKQTELEELFKDTLKFTSVFDITRFTENGFKEKVENEFKSKYAKPLVISSASLVKFYNDAKCLAAQISHLYREKQLSSGEPQHRWHPAGIRAVEKEGPTYTNLFKENWDDSCKIDSIASIDSPVAYLRALYLFAEQLEMSASQSKTEIAVKTEKEEKTETDAKTDKKTKAKTPTDNRIRLKTRRPELANLVIDQYSTFTPQPMLKIVNDLLEKNIKEAMKDGPDKEKSTYELLALRSYPFALPYEFFHHQCLLGLSGEKPSLGELNYRITTHLPLTQTMNFQYGQISNSTPSIAQQLMSGLSPKQQGLLIEDLIATPEDNYWKKIYGTAAKDNLSNLDTFLKHTGLNAEQLEALVAQGKNSPRLSSNYLTPIKPSGLYGARYVNGPSLSNTTNNMKVVAKEITATSHERLQRMQRMIRLQRWLDISFVELDALIISVFNSSTPINNNMHFDTHTVQTLGVYRYLKRRYSINADEFAAVLYQLSPYAIGDQVSLFDRVFNQTRLFEKHLALDGRSFSAEDTDKASHTVLQHLSASLGLPLAEDSLLKIVKNTQKHLGCLKVDLDTLSSIYRQARIARMFGISIADCTTLSTLLGGESVSRCLTNPIDNIRTLKVTAREDNMSVEVVARFRLPRQFCKDYLPELLPGSTLTTNTSWFANKNTVNEFSISFPASSDSNKVPRITIYGIPTAAPDSVVSLAGCGINVIHGNFDELINRSTSWVILARTPLSNQEKELSLFNTQLKQTEPMRSYPSNMLDVLMQLDWITNWLSESVYTIPKLKHLLLSTTNSNAHALQNMQQHLTKLKKDSDQRKVTTAEINALSLPKLPKDSTWWSLMASTLLDANGLVKNFAPTITDDVPKKLVDVLQSVIAPLVLNIDAAENTRLKDDCQKKLKDLLLLAHDRQLHLVEQLLQETCQLPMNSAKGVLLWANTSAYEILNATQDDANNESYLTKLSKTLPKVLRHAEAAVQLHLSRSALHLFLEHPDWLEPSDTTQKLTLTLSSLYLLDRFNHGMTTHQYPEENVLSYLKFANSEATTAEKNSLLASLLNWTTEQVTELTATLTHQQARTVKDLDWVMRCYTTCKATGLTTGSLLDATALNNNSTTDDWKKIGEAVMATSR